MHTSIQTRAVGEITVIDCSGQITLGETASLFRNTVRAVLKDGTKKLLLNLAGVTYLDSTGIGELVGVFTSAYNAQVQLKLAHLPPKVLDLLQITMLAPVFEIFNTETEAIASFK